MKRLPLASSQESRSWFKTTILIHRRGFGSVVGLFVLSAMIGLVGPQILGRLVDSVISGTSDSHIDLLAIAFIVTVLGQTVVTRFAQFRSRVVGEQVLAESREQLVGNALTLPLNTIEAAGTGDLLSRATTDVDRIDTVVRMAGPKIFVSIVAILATLTAIIVTSPLLALGLLVSVPPILISSIWYQRSFSAPGTLMLETWSDLQADMHETLEGARTAEALGLVENRIQSGYQALAKAIANEQLLSRLLVFWLPWLNIGYVLPLAVIIILGGFAYSHDLVGLGTITTVLLYTQSLMGPLDTLLTWFEELQLSSTALRRILGVKALSAQPTANAPKSQDLELSNVHFGYSANHKVLHDINLQIPAGQRLAIVGPSGAGKSTLGRLIAGVAAPTAGSIRIGDIEVTTLSEDTLRGEVLLLTQEHHVFAGSVRDNLTLPVRPAGGDWSDEELWAALTSIEVSDWVKKLPEGLDTKLGSGAVAVPAAIAQQLALARVVLADPHTLVLDEATSLLDTGSARHLERSLSRILEGKTVIAIAHRLHIAATADRIAVVENGRITELGSHAELLEANGPYAHLVRAATAQV